MLEKRLFDAWGAIAQVQDGNNNILNVLTILDRGYTGHKHLQSVGLIDMNARLYDPKLHRFLQPDNYVQDPSNTQNYNRYGYCWNNPLKYSDATGELFGWDDLAIAFVGGVINWASNGCQFNAAGLSYFGTGAVAAIAFEYGGPFASAAVIGIGNSVTNQINNGGRVDPWKVFGDTLTGVVITGVTMGVMQAVSSIASSVPKPQISVISDITPSGIVPVQGAVLPAESTVTAQATATTVANTASEIPVDAVKEIVKNTPITDVNRVFTCKGCGIEHLDDVVIKGADKASGAYLLKFKSGFFYAGKGLEPRMLQSIIRIERDYGDKLISKEFFEATSTNQAFKIEFQVMMENGGPQSYSELSKTYNLIHSPGAKLSGF